MKNCKEKSSIVIARLNIEKINEDRIVVRLSRAEFPRDAYSTRYAPIFTPFNTGRSVIWFLWERSGKNETTKKVKNRTNNNK